MDPNGRSSAHLRKLALFLCLSGVVLLTNGRRHGKWIPNYAGPYRVLVRRIGNESQDYNCTGDAWSRLHTTQVRGKQPQYGWGLAYAGLPLTDDYKAEVTLASRSNNQWKKNAFVVNLDRACHSAKLHCPSVAQLFYGRDYDCPFPPFGLREIKNQTFDFFFPKFPVMPYGRYLVNMAVLKENTCRAVFVADIDIVPRL